MKFPFARTALLAVSCVLAACGGKAEFQIKGTITNLNYDGLVLSTNGMNLSVPKGATSFVFPNTIGYGERYAIVPTNPPHMVCSVAYGNDVAGRTASINAQVFCVQNSYPIGGSVSGLTADGLVLTNGSTGGQLTVVANATTFTMPSAVPDSSTYGVTVLAQPTGLNCSVANGTGTMGEAAVTNIAITCVPKT